jgi:hypothetical protein
LTRQHPKRTLNKLPLDQKPTPIDSDSRGSHSHTYSKEHDKFQSHAA